MNQGTPTELLLTRGSYWQFDPNLGVNTGRGICNIVSKGISICTESKNVAYGGRYSQCSDLAVLTQHAKPVTWAGIGVPLICFNPSLLFQQDLFVLVDSSICCL